MINSLSAEEIATLRRQYPRSRFGAALLAAIDDAAAARAAVAHMEGDFNDAMHEIHRLKRALAFYADPATWEVSEYSSVYLSNALRDRGKRARGALGQAVK